MKQAILSNWSFFRILRLVLGIAIIIQAIVAKDIMFGLAGLLFSGMAVFNIGCCGSGACYAPIKKSTDNSKETTYEEVV